jgi:hypothetical protein
MGVPSQSSKLIRKDIPTSEKLVGLGILLLLIAVASLVYFKGGQFSPETYALNPLSLNSTRAAIEGDATTLTGEAENGESIPGQAEGAPRLDRLLPVLTERMEAMGVTEHYNPNTLYEKINGRAPAYLEFNFQELTARSFSISGLPGQYIDVFVFWMDSPLNAFGIFSLEREPSAPPLEFAVDGYRSEMGYFFRVGRAYVQISGDRSIAALLGMLNSCASGISVVNIDNGFGAGFLANTINRL